MRLFVQAVILGVLAGGVYALMASGLTLAFGIMRVINVAQGVMIILGAYISYSLFTHFSVDPFLSVLFVVPIVFVLGVVIELVFIRPLRPSDREELSLLVTWAVALGIEGVLGLVYSTTYRSTIPSYANKAWRIGGFAVLQVQVYAFALSVVILAALGLLLAKTRFGRAVRGTVQNPASAALLGVDERKVAAIGFGLSVATAWNLLGGYSGYISLANAAFFGVGAYAIANLFPTSGGPPGYTPFLILPLVGLGVAILSLPIGWVAFRTRGVTFAIVTISLLFVAQTLAFLMRSFTRGSQGMGIGVPRFSVATYERPFYLALLAIFVFAVSVCWYVRRAKLGLALFAIRDDEDRARGLGVHTEVAKLVTFAMSLGITAMIGGVWAYYITYIYPQFAVDPLITIGMVLMVFLGGKGTLWGPLLGAVLLVPAQELLAQNAATARWYLVLYSGVFLLVILLLPRGIIPSIQDLVARLRSKGDGETSPPAAAIPPVRTEVVP